MRSKNFLTFPEQKELQVQPKYTEIEGEVTLGNQLFAAQLNKGATLQSLSILETLNL
jgi:hypothetical protein